MQVNGKFALSFEEGQQQVERIWGIRDEVIRWQKEVADLVVK